MHTAYERVTLSWEAPADDGGSQLTAYEAQATETAVTAVGHRCGPVGPNVRSCTIGGLTAGRQYGLRVRAYNSRGPSEWSPGNQTLRPLQATRRYVRMEPR